MIDLSYTNKDGLNLFEGFSNGFDYHKDGAAEGDGYAHGGYPEVTGETSSYTDTSYRTGDDPDFFHNGNVWVQPSPKPSSSDVEYIFRVACGTNGINLSEFVTEGEFIPFVEGDTYNITYDGATYNNVPVESHTYTVDSEELTILSLGNYNQFLLKTEMGAAVPAADKKNIVDTDQPPFVMVTSEVGIQVIGFLDDVKNYTVVVTSATDSSKTYTLEVSEGDLESISGIYVLPYEANEFIDLLSVEEDKSQDVIIDGVKYTGAWIKEESQEGDGYSLEIEIDDNISYVLSIVPAMQGMPGGVMSMYRGPVTKDITVKLPVMAKPEPQPVTRTLEWYIYEGAGQEPEKILNLGAYDGGTDLFAQGLAVETVGETENYIYVYRMPGWDEVKEEEIIETKVAYVTIDPENLWNEPTIIEVIDPSKYTITPQTVGASDETCNFTFTYDGISLTEENALIHRWGGPK